MSRQPGRGNTGQITLAHGGHGLGDGPALVAPLPVAIGRVGQAARQVGGQFGRVLVDQQQPQGVALL
ncbi:MAG: hypothetical protein AB1801_16085, partial [Chloroflexota bacterium]